MPFKKRSSQSVRSGLTRLSSLKKQLKRVKLPVASPSTLDAARTLVMLVKSARNQRSQTEICKNSVLYPADIGHVMWPASPKGTPFWVTPKKSSFARKSAHCSQTRKARRNIFASHYEISPEKRAPEGHTTVPPEEGHTIVPPEEWHTTVPPEEGHTTVPLEEGHTTVPPEEWDTTVPPEEGRTTVPPKGPCSKGTDATTQTEVSLRPKVFWAVKWSYSHMSNLPRNGFRRLTGLSQRNFEALYTFLGGDEVCARLKNNYREQTPRVLKSFIPPKDRLFLTLVRLRLGKSIEDIALDVGASVGHVSNILYVWVQFLYLQLKRIEKAVLISRDDQKKQKLPACFRPFKNFRLALDTTEVNIQVPYDYQQQGNTWNPYKHDNVILYQVGITAFGSFGHISRGMEGAISDRELFRESKILEQLEFGDMLLVDRGYTVQDLADEYGVKVLHPPFLGKRPRFSPEEELLTALVAHARIHVERAIRKLKCFGILHRITNKMLPILDQIVFVSACLVNFDPNNIIVV